jgi:hypothetical protein
VSATIPGSELPAEGTIPVTVSNPAPGGGTSNALTFSVTPTPDPSTILISEFRFRGSAGPADEFVELYNNSDLAYDISGHTLYALDAGDSPTLVFTFPGTLGSGTTVIDARAHYLVANNSADGYSLTAVAAADGSYTMDIPDGSGIALFAGEPTSNKRIDSVGFDGSNPLFFEGARLAPLVAINGEYSFVRKIVMSTGRPQDTQNSAQDFNFVSTTGAVVDGTISVLGAPGPENLSSPVQRNATVKASLIDPGVLSIAPPNRVRDSTPDICGGPNCLLGTLDIRRQFTNHTGQPVTRLRFRIVDITSAPAPSGKADLRALTSSDISVNLSDGGTALLRGLTLDAPSTTENGGGLNATISAGVVTLASPIGPNASINIRFLLGVQQLGNYRFLVNVEALP